MARGYSIHIGLNEVDPEKYNGWKGELGGCENDARAMLKLAMGADFLPLNLLLTAEATAGNVIKAIKRAARLLREEDTLLLTYSGHGGQVPDLDEDEEDELDETWVLYDREVIDDELYALYGGFARGAHIVVLSDSCSSGTVISLGADGEDTTGQRLVRAIPDDVQEAHLQEYGDQYRRIVQGLRIREHDPIDASVLLLSGCQDYESSTEENGHGLFTRALIDVWDEGRFRGSYRKLHAAILDALPEDADQNPNLFQAGRPDVNFADRKAFSFGNRLRSSWFAPRQAGSEQGDGAPAKRQEAKRITSRR
ncbi:caspase family protein [Marinactinospora thermotolerans]|uniref:caspase family protein n=1 Tax=Marinactinospora thermotolerans TaxID=531310 RepID=UPI003D8CF205